MYYLQVVNPIKLHRNYLKKNEHVLYEYDAAKMQSRYTEKLENVQLL